MLREHATGYSLFDERFPYLFNSYYEAEGQRHPRPKRGMLSRPALDEVCSWRAHVDEALDRHLPSLPPTARELVELGINHEQQHQELMLTDILATFAENPLEPAYGTLPASQSAAGPLLFIDGRAGLEKVGADAEGFAFDAERPCHDVLLHPHVIASRCVTNLEWGQFIADGGYRTPNLWLSAGWDWVQKNDVTAPLYWKDKTSAFTLGGRQEIDLSAPVSNISYFEADAFARWSGARLPSEFEWESFARLEDSSGGNQLDQAAPVIPKAGGSAFGDVWEWTHSAFSAYPGFETAQGAVGEYNGKFMCGQFVLKGASCATPRGHSRATYRNFFPPDARWQFTGLRLARDG